VGAALIGVFLGGGLGAVSRYGVSLAAARAFPTAALPWGTWAVNVAGCFALGLLVPVFAGRPEWPEPVRLGATTGFLGGLTTFSTFGQETVSLAGRAPGLALANVGANVLVGLAAAALGAWLGGRLT
jgi:CrcB protein